MADERWRRQTVGSLRGRLFGGGDAQELIQARELDAGAPRGLAQSALVTVDRFPARVGDEVGLAGAQKGLDGGGVGGLGQVGEGGARAGGVAGGEVGEDRVDGDRKSVV